MRFLFINSMSRTGTSLLYQLLFGHPEIYFAPYRIQFVCSRPFGFPLLDDTSSKEEFLKILMSKTTIASSNGRWPNIETQTLAEVFPDKMSLNNLVIGNSAVESAVRTIHNILGIEMPQDKKYYCLHDDHSYMLGGEIFIHFEGRVLNTIRNPMDMIASKKNMLTMYVYGKENPQNFTLKKEVIQDELIRAYFSWWVASYEYSKGRLLPVFYPLLKSQKIRKQAMEKVGQFLGLEFHNVWLEEKNILDKEKYCNELLANGSSLSTVEYLSSGKLSQDSFGATSYFSLNNEEIELLERLIEYHFIERYKEFEVFWREFDLFYQECFIREERSKKIFEKWVDMYKNNKFKALFNEYSSMNYGKVNANMAFKK